VKRPYPPPEGRRGGPPSRTDRPEVIDPRSSDRYRAVEDGDSGYGNGASGGEFDPSYGRQNGRMYPEQNGGGAFRERNGRPYPAQSGGDRPYREPNGRGPRPGPNGRSYRQQNGFAHGEPDGWVAYAEPDGWSAYPEPNGRGNGTATMPREPGPGTTAEPTLAPSPEEGQPPGRRWQPVLAVLGVMVLQAAISLSLTGSNTAFGDEANYLWVGHLELAHWFDGAAMPFFNPLSGAPEIYPPLGALASSVAGLAGARVLSLIFMLAATAMLYSAASRLLGRRAAIAAVALWAVSVSALKLGAFATFDAMAVFFMCLAAWLVVQAGFRRRSRELAVLAGLAMVAGNLTAFSYAIYDAPFIAVAFCVWLLRYDRRRARVLTLWLLGSVAALGVVVTTAMGLWHDIALTTILRGGANGELELQSYATVGRLTWQWSGLVATLGIAGAIAAAAARNDKRVIALLCVLAGSAVVVPLYQFHLRTAWALDKHVACGIWLASMPAGYLIARVARMPSPRVVVATLAGVGALVFPTIAGWTSAYADYHNWPSAASLIPVVKPLVEAKHGSGLFSSNTTDATILNYYTGELSEGPKWDTGHLVLLPPNEPAGLSPTVLQKRLRGYYWAQVKNDNYFVIGISFPVPTSTFVANGVLPSRAELSQDLSGLESSDSANADLYMYAREVAANSDYRLVAIVPYSDNLQSGTYIVWRELKPEHRAHARAKHARVKHAQ
jgi:Dolichyl-phosphate-mannose-protein mannosyltransferase